MKRVSLPLTFDAYMLHMKWLVEFGVVDDDDVVWSFRDEAVSVLFQKMQRILENNMLKMQRIDDVPLSVRNDATQTNEEKSLIYLVRLVEQIQDTAEGGVHDRRKSRAKQDGDDNDNAG
eukprot:1524991-Rhodomonas_salina.1